MEHTGIAMAAPSTDGRIRWLAIDSGLLKLGTMPGGGGITPIVCEDMLIVPACSADRKSCCASKKPPS